MPDSKQLIPELLLPGTPTTADFDDAPSDRLDSLETTSQQDPLALLFNPPVLPDTPVRTFRHSGWEQRRILLAAALAASNVAAARQDRFSHCGCQAWVLRSVESPDDYRVIPDFCHDRWCVPCAKARSHRIAANLLDHLGDRQARFITLTLKASDHPLRDRIDRLLVAFSKLRRRSFWKERVVGGAAFLHITRGRDGGHWHPHLHVIVEGQFIPKPQLVETWLDLTGDSYVVDVQFVREQSKVGYYVSQYASKPLDAKLLTQPDALTEAIAALRGRKLLYAFGTWSKWSLLAQPSDDAWTLYGHINELLYKARMGDELADLVLTVIQHSPDVFSGDVFTVCLAREPPPCQSRLDSQTQSPTPPTATAIEAPNLPY